MPGPPLTKTDVVERLKAFEEEPYHSYPNEELQPGCLELYKREKMRAPSCPRSSDFSGTTLSVRKRDGAQSSKNAISVGAKKTGSRASSGYFPVPIAHGHK